MGNCLKEITIETPFQKTHPWVQHIKGEFSEDKNFEGKVLKDEVIKNSRVTLKEILQKEKSNN